jgi:xanthine dehydrogenase YagS FAD-binding subunit
MRWRSSPSSAKETTMRQFDYSSPTTIDEALRQLGQGGAGAARPLAGGTDLITLMKADIAAPAQLINIKQIDEIPRGIAQSGDRLTIGALTTLSEIELHPAVAERYPALAEAAAVAATPQLRNMATLGGNLLQRPRCWYFRSPHFNCWLKGGEECQARDGENQHHALFGESPCVAVHPSDIAPALLALGAEVRLRGPAGERTLPLDDFFAEPADQRRTETTLGADELVLSIELPALPANTRSTYLKAMDRKVWAFALVGVAAALRLDGRAIAGARLVLSGVAPIPWRARAAEQALVGSEPGDELFARVAELALEGAQPLEHNGYKVPLAKALVRRALGTLAAQ